MLHHRYDYQSNLEASLRINWRIEDVIAGRTFDYGKPFLPDSLAGVTGIRCLTAKEKLKLNQIRGYTYLYLFGLVEEYILPGGSRTPTFFEFRERLPDHRSGLEPLSKRNSIRRLE